jgi:pimeloyl-ACP methyl ester carboxylesterase
MTFFAVHSAAWQKGGMEMLTTSDGRRLAAHRRAGQGPGVIFLGGFRSDMTGTKAVHLQAWAEGQGRAFVRFDYSGHGASAGAFAEGCITDWAADAAAVLAATDGPQVLVGSSMGGWIALLLARSQPARIAGMVTIAAAPDFTDDIRAGLTPAEQAALAATGAVIAPSDYGDPYQFTRRLLDDGADNRIFDRPLALPMPVRMLQGTADADVPVSTALRLLDHATGPDIRLTLVKGADHRFSTPACLTLITQAIAEVSHAPDR